MPKKADLKIVKPEPVEKALPCGEEWNGLDWEDWYDDDRLAREWEERMNLEPEPKPMLHRKRIERLLPHFYTGAEITQFTDRLFAADLKKERWERVLKKIKNVESIMKKRIGHCDETIRKARQDIQRGQEDRKTFVEEIILYDEGFVEMVRLDTGEKIGTRPIRDDERQMPLVA